ncbi:winged helix-turn-helix domain-containing protein [Viridibacillus arvi]|uniref:winged helix-turn-helix domain-containing protein n=1 Tax=Viridibacillus arvi TaxID=263475 RepID=UPI00187B5C57|nr:winged helix-turn-helix domain-containing protein [Viridibacillus sp. JNUCC-6]QOV10114.1 winged helix-turn-helix domain-containing protein [Viridibacillus sp. JNUCC-6]
MSKEQYHAGNSLTLRLRKSDEGIMRWAGAQSEIGDSIRFLIEQEIQRNGFKDLSLEIKNKRPILPTSTDIEPNLLAYLYNRNEPVAINEAYEEMRELFEITEDEARITVRDGQEPQWKNNVRWASQQLNIKNFIRKDSQYGYWEISEDGKVYYEKTQNNITMQKEVAHKPI